VPCPHRTYRITGVSSRIHAATHDFAGALPYAPRASLAGSSCAVLLVCKFLHTSARFRLRGVRAGKDAADLVRLSAENAIEVPAVGDVTNTFCLSLLLWSKNRAIKRVKK
jgi:hypothetical protein